MNAQQLNASQRTSNNQESQNSSNCKNLVCYICHRFDDNKDPSLWLVCESETAQADSCGFSCHLECAFQRKIVGVVNVGQFGQLDGSYCCSSCGKVSEILGFLKKQLGVAKDTCLVDVLRYRISLSYRLLDHTLRLKELHEILKDAKRKLDTEVGQDRGCGLLAAADVRKLCADAIKKADELLANPSKQLPNSIVALLPDACGFAFEEVTSSSVVMVLIETPTALIDGIKGYKLWYRRSRLEGFSTEPACSFTREQRRILISDLQPCTEYTFRVVSYKDAGDLGCSEARCLMKSVEIIHNTPERNPCLEGNSPYASNGTREAISSPPTTSGRDLNVNSVIDLNEDVTAPSESSRDEENGFTTEQSRENFQAKVALKESTRPFEKTPDCNSNPNNGSGFRTVGALGESFEVCVKTVRLLEREGHIEREFRKKFLTWFSLTSTVDEKRVVIAFVRALAEDPKSLAEQLVDSFSEIIFAKRSKHM